MNETANHMEQLLESANQYGKLSTELWKLKAVDKSAELLASTTKVLLLLFIFVISFLFCSVGLALFLGSFFSNMPLGFLLTGFVFGLIGILIYIMRNHWIKWPVRNAFIHAILKNSHASTS
ncbi:MAG: hypothetical protein CFE25_02830 [Chitinophagaceae bacterium BSSC1]|nr:MAG: hypothetical protein CFE25_02830 [Chitinophagaceae bacterium BSSC1]